jgi:protein TonB
VIKKSLHPLLDMEAMRLVSGMPDWTPGLQDGKPVDVQVMVPVAFKLP